MLDVGAEALRLGVGLGRVRVGDTTFAFLEAGPSDGPLALCLHGFPDSAWTWRHLLPRLAATGWRAVAPWMRGYWPTDAPQRRWTDPAQLSRDALGLREALAGDRTSVLIGHDWGAIATHGAIGPGTPFAAAVTLAVPPPSTLPTTPWKDPRQAMLSWYALLLGLPATSGLLRLRDDAFVASLWRRWSPGYEPTDLDLDGWRTAAGPDGGRAAAGYYRAVVPALLARRWPAGDGRPAIPLLHLAGARDGCMHAGQVARTAAWLPTGSHARVVEGAGHFLHLEQPDTVADLVLGHLRTSVPGGSATDPG